MVKHSGSKPEHPEFSELAESLFSLIHYRSSVQKKCAHLGEMECRFLNLLACQKEPIRMNTLAELLGVSESRITRLVERTVKKGLVTKHRSAHDRRSWKVDISTQGLDANMNVSAVSMEVQSELMSNLPEEEREVIYQCVKIYIETFHKILEKKDAALENANQTVLR